MKTKKPCSNCTSRPDCSCTVCFCRRRDREMDAELQARGKFYRLPFSFEAAPDVDLDLDALFSVGESPASKR